MSVLGSHIAWRQSPFAYTIHSRESVMHKTQIGGFSSHFRTFVSVLPFPYSRFRTSALAPNFVK